MLEASNRSCAQVVDTNMTTWHQRFSHVSYKTILRMEANYLVYGIQIHGEKKKPIGIYSGCAYGKITLLFDKKNSHISRCWTCLLYGHMRTLSDSFLFRGHVLHHFYWRFKRNTSRFLCEIGQRYLVLIKTYLCKIISETWKIIKTVPCKQEIPPNRNPPRPAHLLEPRTKYGLYLKAGCEHPSGSKSFVHIPDTQRRKLDPKSLRCFLIGYCDLQNKYRFLGSQKSYSLNGCPH